MREIPDDTFSGQSVGGCGRPGVNRPTAARFGKLLFDPEPQATAFSSGERWITEWCEA